MCSFPRKKAAALSCFRAPRRLNGARFLAGARELSAERSRSIRADRLRFARQEIARAADRVVRISDLSRLRAGRKRRLLGIALGVGTRVGQRTASSARPASTTAARSAATAEAAGDAVDHSPATTVAAAARAAVAIAVAACAAIAVLSAAATLFATTVVRTEVGHSFPAAATGPARVPHDGRPRRVARCGDVTRRATAATAQQAP